MNNMTTEELMNEIEDIITRREKSLKNYINEYFSREEINSHGDNLINLIVNEGDISYLRMLILKNKTIEK
jgi:hypothetical protein